MYILYNRNVMEHYEMHPETITTSITMTISPEIGIMVLHWFQNKTYFNNSR